MTVNLLPLRAQLLVVCRTNDGNPLVTAIAILLTTIKTVPDPRLLYRPPDDSMAFLARPPRKDKTRGFVPPHQA